MVHDKVGKLPGPDKGLTKVIEESGKSILNGLKKSDPFCDNQCKFARQCYADSKTDCTQARCVYEVECNICNNIIANNKKHNYTGTTGCSLHKRLVEHDDSVQRNDQTNAMNKHMKLKHPDTTPDFTAKIIDRQRFNLQRYVSESLFIEKNTLNTNVVVLNSKSEWGRQKLTRIRLTDNT